MRLLLPGLVASGISHVVGAVCPLLTQIVAVRTLALAEYGTYAASLAVVLLGELVFLNRGSEIALRYVGVPWLSGDFAGAHAASRELWKSDLYWTFGAWLLIAAAAYPAQLLFGVSAIQVTVLAFNLPAQSGYGISKSLFVVTERVTEQAMFETGYAIFACIVGIAGVLTMGVWGLIAGTVSAALAKTIVAHVWVRTFWPAEALGVDAQAAPDLRHFRSSSLRSIVRNALSGAAEQVDILLVSAFAGPASAGTYKIAKSLASLPPRVVGPLWVALRPQSVRSWYERGSSGLMRVIWRPAVGVACAVLIGLPLAWWLRDEIAMMFFGEKGRGAAIAFVILLFGTGAFHAATAPWYRIIVAIDSDRVYGVAASFVLLGAVAGLGIAFGRSSIEHMAAAVSAALIVASAFSWWSVLGVRPRAGAVTQR